MKQIELVFEELKNGPGTSYDISQETGLSVKHVSAYLSDLGKMGWIKKVGTHEVFLDNGGGGKNKKPIYAVWDVCV